MKRWIQVIAISTMCAIIPPLGIIVGIAWIMEIIRESQKQNIQIKQMHDYIAEKTKEVTENHYIGEVPNEASVKLQLKLINETIAKIDKIRQLEANELAQETIDKVLERPVKVYEK